MTCFRCGSNGRINLPSAQEYPVYRKASYSLCTLHLPKDKAIESSEVDPWAEGKLRMTLRLEVEYHCKQLKRGEF